MASNLSQLIQTGLTTTLESLLSKPTTLDHITRVHTADLQGSCIQVDTQFKFESIESSWRFFIPALSANYILNLMMGDTSEATEEVDADTLDALNEVVSNICGALSTAINAEAIDGLGNVQFSLVSNEILTDPSNIEISTNLFRFAISLYGHIVYFFIEFDEDILSFIEEITSSEMKQEDIFNLEEKKETNEEENIENNDSNEKVIEEDNNTNDDTNKKVIEEENNSTTEDKDEPIEDEEEEKKEKFAFLKKLNIFKTDSNIELTSEEKKQLKLKKAIIIVTVLFILMLLTTAILYFMGTFEPKVIEQPLDLNQTIKKDTIVKIQAKEPIKYIDFKMSQINVNRLNRKLYLLTKYEILEDDATEKQKMIEKEKEYRIKQAKYDSFSKLNKEEPIFTSQEKSKAIAKLKNNYKLSNTSQKDPKEKNTHYFIKLPTNKIAYFKDFIKKARKSKANLSICKDKDERTQIFIGPIKNKKINEQLISTLNDKLKPQITILQLNENEFKSNCIF